ncbi:sugar porter family MFS transporter [Agaribacterium haliotis]|uniref:sugar porter family MFS transporter n=1 Tax=Agaribacterium haliotis TaxID=2013869 RepID=UPI000BB53ED2|nr:sugar porter family MFS transporter [Agaribacterium haliotis]
MSDTPSTEMTAGAMSDAATDSQQSNFMSKEKRNAFAYAFIVAIGGFIFGLDLMLISGTWESLTIQYNLTAAQQGLIVSGPGIGALAALAVAGIFCDRYGRKATLLVIAALYTISAIGSAWAPSWMWLFTFRLIGGLAFTSLSLASMYIGEIAPPHMRGKLVGMNQLNIAVGILAASFFNYWIVGVVADGGTAWANAINLTEANIWRWMLGMEIVPAIIWLALLVIIPESPRWLMINGKHKKAESVLRKITPADEVEEELRQIEENLKDTNHTVSYPQQAKILFSKRMRIALYIGLAMAVVQPMTGMNAALAFMPTIFSQAGAGDDAFFNTMLISFVGMFFTLFALAVIDKLGRRLILLGGLAACTLGMALITWGFGTAVYEITPEALAFVSDKVDVALLQPLLSQEFTSETAFKAAVLQAVGAESMNVIESDLLIHAASMHGALVLAGLLIFVCSYNFSVGPVLWILFSEVFPTKVRALAITGCAFITSVFGGFVVPAFFPVQLEVFGSTYTFVIYAIFCAVGFGLMYVLCPETKNRTIEEIEKELSERSLKA